MRKPTWNDENKYTQDTRTSGDRNDRSRKNLHRSNTLEARDYDRVDNDEYCMYCGRGELKE